MIKQGNQAEHFQIHKKAKQYQYSPLLSIEDLPQALYSRTEPHSIVDRQKHAGIFKTLAGLFAEKIRCGSQSQRCETQHDPVCAFFAMWV